MSCIVIIGMGRSGTSLLGQVLQAKNIWFGEKADLVGPSPINIYGNQEHIGIQYIHRELLKNVFGLDTWLFLGNLEKNWHKHFSVVPYKEALKEELNKLFSKSNNIGFKDARTTMLLPLWKDIFKEENIKAEYILCKRAPENIYKSLIRSGEVLNFPSDQDVPLEHIEKIYQQYMASARLVPFKLTINFEDWFLRPEFVDEFLSRTFSLPKEIGLNLVDKKEKHF